MSRPTHQFSQTKRADIPRSSFDLSHNLKTSFNAGLLIPILSLEVLPGDTINCRAAMFGRIPTLIKPLLDNLYVETFFFFVPYRQIWDNWEKFNGEQVTPGDSTDFTIPRVDAASVAIGQSLGDYMGIPPGLDTDQVFVSALPFRAYTAIYNFWFRDENLVDPEMVNTGDGPDTAANSYSMLDDPLRRRKRRDYLTSCLPWPQKGAAVLLPLGGSATVMTPTAETEDISIWSTAEGGFEHMATNDGNNLTLGPNAGEVATFMYADLSTATAININDLRESFQIQKLLERDARGGTRYPEILRSHFQVTDPSLLVHQRPLFLGGGSEAINVTPIQQTGETDTGTPQGNLAAMGTVSGRGHGFTSSFTEHGHVIGLVNLRADLTYQQGLERYWSRQTRYDFYWPALSHLGEQAVLNQEIFISNVTATDEGVFGYMPRYDEYRFKQSQVCALFRSAAAAPLDIWHLAQDFAALPVLDKAFIEDDAPMERVIAVTTEPHVLLDVFFKIRAARPLPLYATPGMIDHF